MQPTLLRAITFMIVASPCAVVLATMPPLLSSIANAGRHGVLVKSAVVMEQLGQTSRVAFDKTGTLTEGRPRLTGVTVDGPLDECEALRLAAAAEVPSQHPLGAAVVAAANDAGLRRPSRRGLRLGAGPRGHGHRRRAPGRGAEPGRRRHTGAGVGSAESVDSAQRRGDTAVLVLLDACPGRACSSLTDRLRPDAAAAVAALIGITEQPPVLLTGDNAGRRPAGRGRRGHRRGPRRAAARSRR